MGKASFDHETKRIQKRNVKVMGKDSINGSRLPDGK